MARFRSSIRTSRTKARASAPPRWPFVLNQDHWAARGLGHFWTAHTHGFVDLGPHKLHIPMQAAMVTEFDQQLGDGVNFTRAGVAVSNADVPTDGGAPWTLFAAFGALPNSNNQGLVSFGAAGPNPNQGPHLMAEQNAGVYCAVWGDGTVKGPDVSNKGAASWLVGTYNGNTGGTEINGVLYYDGRKVGETIFSFAGSNGSCRVGMINNDASDADMLIKHVGIAHREWTRTEAFEFYNPATRWNMYYELGRRSYFWIPDAAGGGNALPGFFHHRHHNRAG